MMCYIQNYSLFFSFFFLLKMFDNNDSSSDDDENLSKPVLPTADNFIEPIDLDKIPTTGEEYLRQVRYDKKLFYFQRDADCMSIAKAFTSI